MSPVFMIGEDEDDDDEGQGWFAKGGPTTPTTTRHPTPMMMAPTSSLGQ